ncbi:MAG: hypothetical protein AB7S92_26205 [Parvibaculaceae bacterium]
MDRREQIWFTLEQIKVPPPVGFRAGNQCGPFGVAMHRKAMNMKDKQKLLVKTLGADSRMVRARKLAAASLPIVADLYLAHLQACATHRTGDPKRRLRKKSSTR